MNNKECQYETKCRKCGSNQTYPDGFRVISAWPEFEKKMREMVAQPLLMFCDKCNQSTIQDVIAYTDNV